MTQETVHKGTDSVEMIDPRLSLILVVALIIAVFASGSWSQLILLGGVPLFLLWRLKALDVYWERLVWLRWFFLFVPLLHLVLSPGHTLFGLAWLSYDGLIIGVQVAAQVAIALAASLVLVRSADAEQLASAGALLLRPLQLLGIDSDRFVAQILLSLQFVPVLREEAASVSAQLSPSDSRLNKIRQFVETLVSNLAAKADRMAHDAVQVDGKHSVVDRLPPLLPFCYAEQVAVGSALVIGIICFGLL